MNEHDISPSPVKTSSWLNIPLAVLIAGCMISGSILFVGSGGSASIFRVGAKVPAAEEEITPAAIQNPESLVGTDDPIIGSADAPVTIVEFSDFQCPYCRSFWNDTYSQLKKEYVDTGKARIVFRDFPLAFHDAAKPSALAANCAFEQGKFWEYHDKLFLEQGKKGQNTISYGIPELKAWAQQIGLQTVQFNQCLDSAKYSAEVDQDLADGSAAGVTGTPSFFINGQLIVGAQPFSAFKAAIDAELAR